MTEMHANTSKSSKTAEGKSDARNGVYALIDQSIVSGTRFLVTVLVAKACGEVVLGVYALVLSMVLMALIVQQTLVTTPYSNFRNRVQAKSNYYGDVWLQSVLVALLSGLLIAVIGGVFWLLSPAGQADSDKFPMAQMALACVSAAIAVPFMVSVEFFRRTWLIRMQSKSALILDALISVAVLSVLGALFYLDRLDANAVFGVLAVVNLVAALVGLRLLRPHLDLSQNTAMEHLRKHWGFGKWIFSSEAMTFGRGHLLKWIIGGFLGIGATGIYSACDSLMRAINPFFLAVASVAEPTLAAGYAKSGRTEVKRIAFKVLAIMVAGTLPICLIVSLLSEHLLLYFYGPTFATYAWVVVWLALAAFVYSNGYPLANAIQAIDRPEINFRVRMFTFVFVISASLLVAPTWGLAGLAFLQLVSAILSFSIRVAVFRYLFSPPGKALADHPTRQMS